MQDDGEADDPRDAADAFPHAASFDRRADSCYNEEIAIATVVRDFRATLPDAKIYVYDNNSTDRTLEIAAAAGAICRNWSLREKATS